MFTSIFLSDENVNLSDKEVDSISEKVISDMPYREVPQTTPLQRAFQPASTPEHLTHRFMVSVLNSFSLFHLCFPW